MARTTFKSAEVIFNNLLRTMIYQTVSIHTRTQLDSLISEISVISNLHTRILRQIRVRHKKIHKMYSLSNTEKQNLSKRILMEENLVVSTMFFECLI